MNYLAHLYLSGVHDDVMLGNFIADHVRGSAYNNFPPMVQAGILLHRAIDSFTDSHPVVERSKSRIRTSFRKYTPVVMDVFYDHFLAVQWGEYHPEPLELYSRNCYAFMRNKEEWLPVRTRHMLGFMEPQNWLLNYGNMDGIQKAMTGLSRRARFESGMESAHLLLELHYEDLVEDFNAFFPELCSYSGKLLERLTSNQSRFSM